MVCLDKKDNREKLFLGPLEMLVLMVPLVCQEAKENWEKLDQED